MRAVLRLAIQIGLIVLLIWWVIKYTTLDDRVVQFFRSNSDTTTQTGNVVPTENTLCTTPWGLSIPDGSSVYAYQTDRPDQFGACTEEIRTCNAGVLDGSFAFPSCVAEGAQQQANNTQTIPGASCSTPWGEILHDGSYIIAYESTNSCRFEKRYCENGRLNGSFAANTCYSPREVAQQQTAPVSQPVVSTTPQISTINYGSVGGDEYQGPSRTSLNGITTVIYSWNDNKTNPTTKPANDSTYIQPTAYRNFDLTQHGCSTPWGTYLDHGDSVIAYRSPTPASKWASCSYERRTCFQGILGGSYAYSSCTLADSNNILNNNGQDYYYPSTTRPAIISSTKRSCTTPWGETVRNGDHVLAYKNSYTSQGYACQGEYRYCNDGRLDGSYQHRSCVMSQDRYRCTIPRGGSIPHGSSIVAYANASSPCASQVRTCNYGRLAGSYNHQSCEQKTTYYKSCQLPRGGTISHGASAIAYDSPGGNCFTQKRTCYDGVLAGSYQYSSCNRDYNYSHSWCAFGGCGWPYYYNNNTYNSYNYHSCQLPWGGAIAHGASVIAYSSANGPCNTETRRCHNGYLQGSYQYGSCYNNNGNNNNNYKSCTTPWWQTIAHGAKVEAYQTTSSPCYKQTRTCNNGYLDGSYQHSYCNATTNGGGQDQYGTRVDVGVKEWNIDSSDTCNANATTSYQCGSLGTNSCTDYSRVSCISFSPLVCSYWKRDVKCVK